MAEKKDLKKERTLLLIKPDGVRRGLIGEVITRIETRGLKIVALQLVRPTRDQIDRHYPSDKAWVTRVGSKTLETYEKNDMDALKEVGTDDPFKIGSMVREWTLDFMCSGPIVKMVIEGVHARSMIRKLAGATMPAFADIGSIRGDFSVDSAAIANADKRSVRNLVHASETEEEFENEFGLWFGKDEVHEYERNDDGIVF
jgi:nucleoside-diphosphate kinase